MNCRCELAAGLPRLPRKVLRAAPTKAREETNLDRTVATARTK